MKKLYKQPEIDLLILNSKEYLLFDSQEVKVYGNDNEVDDPFDDIFAL